MPGTRAILSALSAVACAATLTACGGDDESGTIPTDSGEALLTQLDEVERLVADGECEQAGEAVVALAQGINDLPGTVDSELRNRLVEASTNLEGLTEDPTKCEPAGTTGETGQVEETEPTTTEPTTTTETTTTEEPPPDEGDDEGPPQPPGQDGGGNQGGGGGQGDGGDDGSGGIGSGD